ncbi:actin-like atpase domain-containing protein [Diplodia corticola]|uniref:Actin-like atpase domain-containing protein n=1 Tax=Diplodia corticola TaxID=236234 RepID=A0A1J9RYZ5_9PEZI|nr:actin-like atpase domain-containing protein [Diplodia corticola]OJD32669.1 actin-like atpase domain-containing protein [Diplodia corticola]
MGSTEWTPDFVIGIDFGMTCTGVSYSMGPAWPSPKTIQSWPGKIGTELANKVMTAVAYHSHSHQAQAWGFLCDTISESNRDIRIEELFKLYLDPTYVDTDPQSPSVQDAQIWFQAYMRFLHEYLEDYFFTRFPRWRNQRAEFVFSVPTTWKNPAMIAELSRLIKRAGFGENLDHVVRISLTEAEAAAVYVAKNTYQKDDVFLICDAGGGTTDINLLKLLSSSSSTQLLPLSSVEGIAAGSSLLDFKMAQIIAGRLELIKQHLVGAPADIAERMLSERFETFKCSFGSPVMNVEQLPLPVPGLGIGQSFPSAGIVDSNMVIHREELKVLFDGQIDKICNLIDTQLLYLQENYPAEQLSYIVASGGLGSSPYLLQQLKNRYELSHRMKHSNAQRVRILCAPEPQLAVCHGLVMERIQEIVSKSVVFKVRRCRVSYGILCRELYDSKKHTGRAPTVDPRDGKRWVEDQIHWIIKQGESIDTTQGVRYKYRVKRDLGAETLPWRATVVMSQLPPNQLPRSLKAYGVTPVCVLHASLMASEVHRKNRRWYAWAREHWSAELELRVFVGPADLRFELWGQNGPLNMGDGVVSVDWEAPSQMDSAHEIQGRSELEGKTHAAFGSFTS